MKYIDIQYYKTKIGELLLASYNNQLCILDYRYRRARKTIDNRIKQEVNSKFNEKSSEVIEETKKQIDEYLSGRRRKFNIPLLMIGTSFQKSVWEQLLKIPYGSTLTYKELAKSIGNENGVRAVASANGANAIALIIPCHRIIGSKGELVGYSGGLNSKKRILNLETNCKKTLTHYRDHL